jgi:hypothetical protein
VSFCLQEKSDRSAIQERGESNDRSTAAGQTTRLATSENERSRASLHLVEGLALVMLCSCKPIIRKQAVIVLKEVRNLFVLLAIPKVGEFCDDCAVASAFCLGISYFGTVDVD